MHSTLSLLAVRLIYTMWSHERIVTLDPLPTIHLLSPPSRHRRRRLKLLHHRRSSLLRRRPRRPPPPSLRLTDPYSRAPLASTSGAPPLKFSPARLT